MIIEFRQKIKDKKIMVRFDEEDYKQVKLIAKNNNEGMGRVIGLIVKEYLKVENIKIKNKEK